MTKKQCEKCDQRNCKTGDFCFWHGKFDFQLKEKDNEYWKNCDYENTSCKRGGRREGSGRKKLAEPKTTISFRVTAETKQLIQDARARGVDTNGIMTAVLQHLSNDY